MASDEDFFDRIFSVNDTLDPDNLVNNLELDEILNSLRDEMASTETQQQPSQAQQQQTVPLDTPPLPNLSPQPALHQHAPYVGPPSPLEPQVIETTTTTLPENVVTTTATSSSRKTLPQYQAAKKQPRETYRTRARGAVNTPPPLPKRRKARPKVQSTPPPAAPPPPTPQRNSPPTVAAKTPSRIQRNVTRNLRSSGFSSYPALLMSHVSNTAFTRFVRLVVNESGRTRFTITADALLRLQFEALRFLVTNVIQFYSVYENVTTTPYKCGKRQSIIIQPNHIHHWFSALYAYYRANEAKKMCPGAPSRTKSATNATRTKPYIPYHPPSKTTAGGARKRKEVLDASCVLVSPVTHRAKLNFNHVLCECVNDHFRQTGSHSKYRPLRARLSADAMVELNQVFVMVVGRLLDQMRIIAESRRRNAAATGVRLVESDVVYAASYLYPECEVVATNLVHSGSGGSKGTATKGRQQQQQQQNRGRRRRVISSSSDED